MDSKLTVNGLYPYALAEGEGVGTAYEYRAKRLVLSRWLATTAYPRRVLVAGLPQKYGASLDFALIAYECGAHLVVADERQLALDRFQQSLARIQRQGSLVELRWEPTLVSSLAALPTSGGKFDLALCSEVLQRLDPPERRGFVSMLRRDVTDRLALFCPNADNPSHTAISGLAGLTLDEIGQLGEDKLAQIGYIDMPPFPPGITRSDEQREQAASGRLEAVAMAGLDLYARLERLVPEIIRRRQSHIVYALWESNRTVS